VPIEVGAGHEYMIHRHGFLRATPQIQISVGFQQSLGAGILGGYSFLLQQVSGMGTAWIELSGELIAAHFQTGAQPHGEHTHAAQGRSTGRRRWRYRGETSGSNHGRPLSSGEFLSGEFLDAPQS